MATPTLGMKPTSGELVAGGTNSHRRECIIHNATSQDQAINFMLADTTNFPINYTPIIGGTSYNFIRTTARALPADAKAVPEFWFGDVDYALVGQTNEPFQAGDSTQTFEIGTESVHVFKSKATVAAYTEAGTAVTTTFGSLINVGADADIGGVDLDVPTFTFSVMRIFADADVTEAYIQDVFDVMTNPINDDTFFGFAAGSVKFMGLQGSQRGNEGDWELSFRFAVSPNATGLKFDGITGTESITGVAKKGWEYLWLYMASKPISADSLKIMKPYVVKVYVERVYGDSDFDTLGL